MPLSEATALEQRGRRTDGRPRFHTESYDPFEDRKSLEALAASCHCFSPLVGLADDDPVETLLLDVTGIATLFGGEQAMNQQIEKFFRQQHLTVRIGLGNTVGAAWARAHYSSEYRNDIVELPIEALRLPPASIETLNRLGLEHIGDLLPLPRDELKARFGATLLQRLDQALGKQPEIIASIHSPDDFFVEWLFEHPVTQQSVIQHVIRQLIERLCFLLLKQGKGSLQLHYRLTCQDNEPVMFEVGCYRPTADADHLWKLTESHLDRLVLRDPVTGIWVCATRHDRLSQRQKELFDDDHIRQNSPLVASLIDRLTSRLGRHAIVRSVLQSDAQPEKAFRYEPLVGGNKPSKRSIERLSFSILDRPLYLMDQPAALRSYAVTPNGPPSRFEYNDEQHIVSRYWGPERIETGWWRQRGVQRDYYRVETSQGFRFWMFRCLHEGSWYLHGMFG